ncbi:hypothetical protein [Bordetella sp. FB-8]|uniref:hypothetical protein n=1 Tax=Bordetella sp. FB-8 TaxID=1159870 RepID=UPI001E5722FA|nr:hypothetical protein [Bordetella sp. FB-8]
MMIPAFQLNYPSGRIGGRGVGEFVVGCPGLLRPELAAGSSPPEGFLNRLFHMPDPRHIAISRHKSGKAFDYMAKNHRKTIPPVVPALLCDEKDASP